MKVEQVQSKVFQLRHGCDVLPNCPTCGVRCRSGQEIGAMIGVKDRLVRAWQYKGLPSYDGIFKDGATRQGKHGVTPQYYCLDEVNMWLMANPKRLRNRKPASWAIVRDDEGREIRRVPANISPLHVTPETYGNFTIGLLTELNEGLV